MEFFFIEKYLRLVTVGCGLDGDKGMSALQMDGEDDLMDVDMEQGVIWSIPYGLYFVYHSNMQAKFLKCKYLLRTSSTVVRYGAII
jgi:hypothetical protein